MDGDGQATARAASTNTASTRFRNERGVIAESYYDLQGLGILEAARRMHPLPKASAESTIRAILQAVEIAMLNLADLMDRAEADIANGAAEAATVKMFWARGFHRLLARLSMMPAQLGFDCCDGGGGTLAIGDSPGFRAYLDALQRFDAAVLARVRSGDLALERVIAHRSLASAEFNLFHLARVCNHEATIWERNLSTVRVPAPTTSYEDFVVPGRMRDVVYDRVLAGDTYFTQFRGLHQVPEILGEEINDRIEQAIRHMRDGSFERAAEHLACVDTLTEGVLASMPPIVDNLATSDYHNIRENLGLTSGSHSVCLRFHLFTHLYEQLCEALGGLLTQFETGPPSGTGSLAWLHLLITYCLKLRAFIFQWRDEHINLPRNNLGGQFTKSLTGSADAVQAVKQMRDSARVKDPMLSLARARSAASQENQSARGRLAEYFDSAASLDSRILAVTGTITQGRFRDVQERLGFFANRCPFAPPPRRRV